MGCALERVVLCTILAGYLCPCFSSGAIADVSCAVSGECLTVCQLPVAQVTSCAFGGDHLDQLFVTTAADGLSAEQLDQQPLAGSLFKIDMSSSSTRGLPANSFVFDPSQIDPRTVKVEESYRLKLENARLRMQLEQFRQNDKLLLVHVISAIPSHLALCRSCLMCQLAQLLCLAHRLRFI